MDEITDCLKGVILKNVADSISTCDRYLNESGTYSAQNNRFENIDVRLLKAYLSEAKNISLSCSDSVLSAIMLFGSIDSQIDLLSCTNTFSQIKSWVSSIIPQLWNLLAKFIKPKGWSLSGAVSCGIPGIFKGNVTAKFDF